MLLRSRQIRSGARSFGTSDERCPRLRDDGDCSCDRSRGLDARRRRLEREQNDEASKKRADQPKDGVTPQKHPSKLVIVGSDARRPTALG